MGTAEQTPFPGLGLGSGAGQAPPVNGPGGSGGAGKGTGRGCSGEGGQERGCPRLLLGDRVGVCALRVLRCLMLLFQRFSRCLFPSAWLSMGSPMPRHFFSPHPAFTKHIKCARTLHFPCQLVSAFVFFFSPLACSAVPGKKLFLLFAPPCVFNALGVPCPFPEHPDSANTLEAPASGCSGKSC